MRKFILSRKFLCSLIGIFFLCTLFLAVIEIHQEGVLHQTASAEENAPQFSSLAMQTEQDELQDSTLVYPISASKKYNCYAYAIGLEERYPAFPHTEEDFAYLPGDISGAHFARDPESLSKAVKADLETLGCSNVQYSTKKPNINDVVAQNKKLICLRTSSANVDFHFMKYDSGAWYHKPGRTAVLKYNYEPDEKEWTNEGLDEELKYVQTTFTYISEIYYITYNEAELFGGGSGTKTDPYIIENETQFRNIRRVYRTTISGSMGNDYVISQAFKLERDIVINGNWAPIEDKFTGSLDGNQHSIEYNINIELPKRDALTGIAPEVRHYWGLFQFIGSGAEVKNLEIKESTIMAPADTTIFSTDIVCVGMLAGTIYNASSIYKVKITKPVICSHFTTSATGGIAGTIYGTPIDNCEVLEMKLINFRGGLGGMAGLGESAEISKFTNGACSGELENTTFSEKEDQMGPVMGNSSEHSSVNVSELTLDKGSCIAEGSLVTLADGTKVAVEDLTGNETLLVWNLFTGDFDVAPILFIDKEPDRNCTSIELIFSDSTSITIMSEHGFWDYNLNKYIYLNDDASQYLGHWFAKQTMLENGDFIMQKVQLVEVNVKREHLAMYSPVTYGHFCYFVNDMLSMPGGIDGLFNIFDVDCANMRYNQEKMLEDIQKYGLFTYEEFSKIYNISEQAFEAFGGKYLKVAIGKGMINYDRLNYLIDRYAVYLQNL